MENTEREILNRYKDDANKYNEHSDIFDAMVEHNIFMIRGGMAELHFDENAKFKGIRVNYWTLRK